MNSNYCPVSWIESIAKDYNVDKETVISIYETSETMTEFYEELGGKTDE